MKISNEGLKILRNYIDNPSDFGSINALGSLYWDSLTDSICDVVHNGEDVESFLLREKEFINTGIFSKISGDVLNRYESITTYTGNRVVDLNIIFLTDFIRKSLKTIYSGDEKEKLEFKLKLEKIRFEKSTQTLKNETEKRNKLLSDNNKEREAELVSDGESRDNLRLEIIRFERQSALGHFFSVEERRNFVEMKKEFEESLKKLENLTSAIPDVNARKTLKDSEMKINSLLNDLVSSEIEQKKLESDLESVKEKSLSVSKETVEVLLREKLDYIREIVKLSAKRSRVANSSFLMEVSNSFTKEKVIEIVNKILEFDPYVFKNSRCSVFGKPEIIILPGTGNAVFDWKNNLLVVPLIPYNGNFEESVVSAFVEYRLDVDEDKILLNSYNKLSCYKNMRSLIDIKSSFTRDYTKWITSECSGFKVLEAEVRKWFEYEIAPSKNEIYTPLRLQPFSLTSKESSKLLEDSLVKTEKTTDDLWNLTILNYQNGEFKKSFEFATELAKKESNPMALYNLGIISIKNSQKQSALTALKEFILKHPQSWWASVAREHLRRLQLNG